jgi:signal transduction histidine kinase
LDKDFNNRILIVDDNQAIHTDFRKILQSVAKSAQITGGALEALLQIKVDKKDEVTRQYVVDSALQGQEAVEKVKRAKANDAPYAMAFVDMRMPPGWDGVQTIKHLWEVDASLLCVICTAYSDHSWDDMVRQLGDTDHLLILKKPFDVVEVKQLAAALTKRWNLATEAAMKRSELEHMVEQRTVELKHIHDQLLGVNDDLAKAKNQAEQAAKSRTEFLATMSHEIRTPMNGIVGMTDVLLTTPLNDQQRGYVQTVQRSGDALLSIIDDILDFSKLDAGKMTLEPVTCDLTTLLEDVRLILQPKSEENGNLFEIHIDENVPRYILVDPVRLRQVALNLASNATKFTHKGTVCMHAKATTNLDDPALCDLLISVTDTGIGISKDVIGNLFTMFTQADISTTRKFGGTGLGLAISRKIVDLMDGHIGVQSVEGEGSVFQFKIPVAIISDEQAISEVKQQIGPDQFNALILVVEDNVINQRVARVMLQKLGCQVDMAPHGQEAVKLVGSTHYDLVLMDCQMPVMDGYEATQLIREKFSSDQLPIVAMTANALPPDRERCMNVGMNDFMAKPVKLIAMRSILNKWLNQSQHAEESAA